MGRKRKTTKNQRGRQARVTPRTLDEMDSASERYFEEKSDDDKMDYEDNFRKNFARGWENRQEEENRQENEEGEGDKEEYFVMRPGAESD